jgi:hypothetical protein
MNRREFIGMSAAAAALGWAGIEPQSVWANTRRGFMKGMLARQTMHLTAATAPYLTGFVTELKWNVAQTSLGGALTQQGQDVLGAALNLADQYGKNQIKLRVLTGTHSPEFAMDAGGPRITNWVEGQAGVSYTVPRWWRSQYMDAYEGFMAALAPHLTDPRWLEVVISGPMTVFAEPCIHQYGPLANRQQMQTILEGYSPDQTPTQLDNTNLSALRRAIDIHKIYFDNDGIVGSLAYNPWELINASYGYEVNVNKALNLMSYQKNVLDNIGVWQNNSLRAREDETGAVVQTRTTGGYPEMYARMRSRNWYAQYQTATVARIHENAGTVYDTVRYVVQNYGLSVEMPVGWEQAQWETAQYRGLRLKQEADSLNAAMAANEALINP